MIQSLKVDFKIFIVENEDWISVNQLLGQTDRLVDHRMLREAPDADYFEGGFFIDVDGIAWSDESAIDGYLTHTWFQALKDILNGKMDSMASPWEESRLTLKLEGKKLVLEDISRSGNVSMPKVYVPFLEFVEQIIASSTKLIQLIAELEHEIAFRRSHGVSEKVESMLKHFEQTLHGDSWRKDVQEVVVLFRQYQVQKE